MITFPPNPALNQETIINNVRYKFNGKTWAKVSNPRLVGLTQITVGPTEPTSPSEGDIWFVTL